MGRLWEVFFDVYCIYMYSRYNRMCTTKFTESKITHKSLILKEEDMNSLEDRDGIYKRCRLSCSGGRVWRGIAGRGLWGTALLTVSDAQ